MASYPVLSPHNRCKDYLNLGITHDREYPSVFLQNFLPDLGDGILCKLQGDAFPIIFGAILRGTECVGVCSFRINSGYFQPTNFYNGECVWKQQSKLIYVLGEKIYMIDSSKYVSVNDVPSATYWEPQYSEWRYVPSSGQEGTPEYIEDYWAHDTDSTTEKIWYGYEGWHEAPFSYTWDTLPDSFVFTGKGKYGAGEVGAIDYTVEVVKPEWWKGDTECSLPTSHNQGSVDSQVKMFGVFSPQVASVKQVVVGLQIWEVEYVLNGLSEKHNIAIVEDTRSSPRNYLLGVRITGTPENCEFGSEEFRKDKRETTGWSGTVNGVAWESQEGFNSTSVGTVVTWQISGDSGDSGEDKPVLKTKFLGYYVGPKVETYITQLKMMEAQNVEI